MPVARYFFYVGGVLLALLFAMDTFVPKEPVAGSTASAAPIENPTLRIRSDHKWPERVVYDTSLPTIVPPKVEIAAVPTPAPTVAPVAEIPAKAPASEAFAQYKPAGGSKPEAKPVPKRKIAKARVAPQGPPMRIAQQPQFGFFGSNIW
jgi:hypothetical protein